MKNTTTTTLFCIPLLIASASLTLNGQKIEPGSSFKIGHVRRMNSTDLMVWIKLDTDKPVTLELK